MDRYGMVALEDAVTRMLKRGEEPPVGAYAAFDGVANHAGRHLCVLLPFRAILKALEEDALERSEPGA
jgi:nitrogen fixation NifU-like protein